MFTADQVWGLAVQVNELNKGYYKDDVWDHSGDAPIRTHRANKTLLKELLRDNATPTDDEIAQGQAIRKHFKGFLLKQLTGTMSDFDRTALQLAEMDQFQTQDTYEFAVISCLPNRCQKDQVRSQVQSAKQVSTPLDGQKGDLIKIEVDILMCVRSSTYNKCRISAKAMDKVVDFWYPTPLAEGSTVVIKARIKEFLDDGVTRLNYVKLA